jgi:hypothetical protein
MRDILMGLCYRINICSFCLELRQLRKIALCNNITIVIKIIIIIIFLCNHRTVTRQAYGGMEVLLYSFLTCKCSVSPSDHFIPDQRLHMPAGQQAEWASEAVQTLEYTENLALLGTTSQFLVVHSAVLSLY